MMPQTLNRHLQRLFFYFVLASILSTTSRGRAEILWGTMQRDNLSLTLVVDKTAGKICLEASGPSDKWFGWGFGDATMSGYAIVFNAGNSSGTYFETMMQYGVTPSPQAQQDVTASFNITGGTITYTAFRDLVTSDANDYSNWSSGANNITWAHGSKPFNYHDNRNVETITIASAPAPKLNAVQHDHNAGSTTLTLENLSPASTNKVEFTTALGTTNWSTISNIIFSPQPGGPSLQSFMTGLSVSIASSNTNAAGFYRIRQ